MELNEQEEMDDNSLRYDDYAGSPGRPSLNLSHYCAVCLSADDQPLPTSNFRHSGPP
jgi:hypothetical protein